MDRFLGLLTTFALLALAGFSAKAELRPEPFFLDSSPASIYDYPYHLSLHRYNTHHCGAAIVGSRWALTAASCVWYGSGKDYNVRAGSGNLLYGAAVYQVASIHLHPRFNRSSYDYDIALLNLTRPFVFNSTVRAIQLIGAYQDPKPGSMAVITGWGYSSNTGPSFYYDLRQIKLPIVNQTICQRYNVKNITESMLCAGHISGRPMPCGSSGFPLALAGRLIGIDSFSYGGCGKPGTFEVSARISAPAIRSWITKVSGI